MHTHIPGHMHSYIHRHTHARMHTCTHAHARPSSSYKMKLQRHASKKMASLLPCIQKEAASTVVQPWLIHLEAKATAGTTSRIAQGTLILRRIWDLMAIFSNELPTESCQAAHKAMISSPAPSPGLGNKDESGTQNVTSRMRLEYRMSLYINAKTEAYRHQKRPSTPQPHNRHSSLLMASGLPNWSKSHCIHGGPLGNLHEAQHP